MQLDLSSTLGTHVAQVLDEEEIIETFLKNLRKRKRDDKTLELGKGEWTHAGALREYGGAESYTNSIKNAGPEVVLEVGGNDKAVELIAASESFIECSASTSESIFNSGVHIE